MGGTSTQQQTTQSQTAPWAAAMPEVNQLFGQLGNLIPNSGITSAQNGAIGQLTASGQAGNPYAPGIGGVATNLLSGGGATGQVPSLQQNLASYNSNLSPYLDPNYSTINTPAVQSALQTAAGDVTNQVNGQFAAAGRSDSGMNTQTLARGIAQAQAPIIMGQANQDTQNRIAAANAAYGAGNTTSNAISGLTQTGIANQGAGIDAANSALSANNWGANQVLNAQQLLQSIPAGNLGLLAQIGIPLGQLGQTSNGTSNTTSQMSGAQQFGTIMQGIGQLIPKSPMTFNF